MEDVKIKLSALWIARMLTGIQGDVLRFYEAGMLENIINGTTVIPMTNELLAAMGAMMMLPILMVFLSVQLDYKLNRWLNIIIALFFIVFDGTGFIVPRPLYENVFGIGYVLFCALIVWFAWKWPKEKN
ncbi:MAG: DUF6326 family protein [Candidatus Thorarchaeota archaeon]